MSANSRPGSRKLKYTWQHHQACNMQTHPSNIFLKSTSTLPTDAVFVRLKLNARLIKPTGEVGGAGVRKMRGEAGEDNNNDMYLGVGTPLPPPPNSADTPVTIGGRDQGSVSYRPSVVVSHFASCLRHFRSWLQTPS